MSESKTNPTPIEAVPENKAKTTTPQYRGSEIIRSAAGSTKDILSVVLKPDKLYTKEQFEKLLDDFKKTEVKPTKESKVK